MIENGCRELEDSVHIEKFAKMGCRETAAMVNRKLSEIRTDTVSWYSLNKPESTFSFKMRGVVHFWDSDQILSDLINDDLEREKLISANTISENHNDHQSRSDADSESCELRAIKDAV